MTAKRAQRIPRYKDKEGYYIDIFEEHSDIFLAWTPDGYEEGARLGEETVTHEEAKTTAGALEFARSSYRGYIYRNQTGVYIFESMRVAKEVKRLVNAALWNMQNEKPLPDWAQKAIAEGWNPPKGWKP